MDASADQGETRRTTGFGTAAAVVALLACYVALGMSASVRKSQTGDEGAHLSGGVSYWTYNDYRVQPENGNWPQRLCGLPVWLSGFRFPSPDSPPWRELRQWVVGDQFFYECDNDADAMLLQGRAMTALLGVALGLLVYGWSRRLFGPAGGLLSLALFAFSPTMLTHGFLITSDMASALFFTASVGAVWKLLHRVSPGTILWGWIALSGLFLSKFSAPTIVPMGLVLLGIRLTNPAPLVIAGGRTIEVAGQLKQLAVFLAIMVALAFGVAFSIWASYGFRYSMFNAALDPPTENIPWETVGTKSAVINKAVELARDYHLLPEAYVFGFTHVIHHSEARNAFLNGEFRRFGWTSFFPYCLAMKTPLELFAVLALAAAAAWTFRRSKRDRNTSVEPSSRSPGMRYECAPLATLLVVYWLFALTSHLNIGHRHLMPTYPPMFILAGAAAWWFQPPRRSSISTADSNRRAADGSPTTDGARGVALRMRALVVALIVLSGIEAVWIWPHYLAYFNALAGGPKNGYRHLADSSLDWSQDLKGVKAWLDAHPDDAQDPQRLYFSFYGSPPPEYYGIHAERLPSFPMKSQQGVPQPLTAGTYLISATLLDGVMLTEAGRWNKEYETRLRNLQQNIDVYNQLQGTPEGRERLFSFAPASAWQRMFAMYETLRFSRLASWLRQREPDDQIGYSIFVYRLTDADIAHALDDPPVELLDRPEWQLEDQRLGRDVPDGA